MLEKIQTLIMLVRNLKDALDSGNKLMANELKQSVIDKLGEIESVSINFRENEEK